MQSTITIGAPNQEISRGITSLMSLSRAFESFDDALMARYHDRPMDFADATLVHLAEREGTSVVLTIDHGDFETYRLDRRRKFRIVPAPM